MENKKLYNFISKKFDDNLKEEDEIEEIIKSQKLLKEEENDFKFSEKSLEWLNFFFIDPNIKELYINNNRIASIICLQVLFYLNIFKTISKII